jgi:hypothetical protein
MRLDANRIPLAYRAPFDFGKCYVDERLPGESILDMVLSVPDLPRDFMRNGYVCINNEVVPRNLWKHVRPRPATAEVPICVTLHYALQSPGGGGGGGGRKQILGLVAAIALLVVVAFLTGGAGAAAFPALGGELFLGVTVGQVVGGAVGIAGALAISALTAPPVSAPGVESGASLNSEQAEAAAASGNALDRGGAIPRVIGTRKVFPPFACEPVVELVGQDEYVEALYILNGPHLLEDIRIDGNPIADAEDVDYETREGWTSDTPVTLVERQARTFAPQLELSVHSVDSGNSFLLHQSLPESDLPVWHGVTTRSLMDEIWLHFLLPGGISNATTASVAIPFRIRFRERGETTWINCPEFHAISGSVNQLRFAVQFKWATAVFQAPPGAGSAGDSGAIYYAHIDVPPQTVTPATPTDQEWNANSYFDDAGGGTLYIVPGSTEASTRIQNVALTSNGITFWMDENTFPKGMYEIEIKRGSPYLVASFTGTTYTYSGTVTDFFWYKTSAGNHIVPQSRANISDRCILNRVVSVWNEAPIAALGEGKFSQIAIRALNRSIRQLSVVASGYVRDWDGSGWNDWTTTSNPAPHYADVLSGAQNLDPLAEDLRDDDALVAWRSLCVQNDWTCDSIVNDTRTQDVLGLLASCGYARPYQSDIYGVTVDNDRSADTPTQIFSRRNSVGMKFERGFARVPAGFNVSYRDETEDDDQAQIAVYQRDPSFSDLTVLESVSYDGLISSSKVTARAQFDLDQANLRSTFYTFDTDIENIVCRRGDLVGVQHDVLTSRAGDGYMYSKQTSGSPSQITGITLDAELPITNETEWFSLTDVFTVTDVFLVGITTGIVIRHTDGTLSTHELSNSTGSTKVLTFATPFTDDATIQGFDNNDRKYGCMVVAGDLSYEYRRLLVQSITPKEDLKATLVLVDEATDLVRYTAITRLLLHFEGTDGSTDFEDSSRNDHEVESLDGDPKIDTAQFKFGASSLELDGSSNAFYYPDHKNWNFGRNDFTVDFWIRRNGSQTALAGILGTWTSVVIGGWFFYWGAGGAANAIQFDDGQGVTLTNSTTISDATWTHAAVEQYNGTTKLFIAGTSVASVSTPNGIAYGGTGLAIGSISTGSFVQPIMTGWIDEFRISGIACYQGANFTPESAAYGEPD